VNGRKLGTFGRAGAFSFFSNKVLSVGEGGMVATDDDKLAERVRRLRSHGMTSGTWDRHRGHADSYDVVEIGFNYRLDEVHAALGLVRLPRLEREIARRRELTRTYRRRLGRVPDIILPYADEQVGRSSCYVMPVMLADPDRRTHFRRILHDEHGVQTSVLYPAIHELSAYRKRSPDVSLPRTELASRSEVTIPLYPHMSADDQEQVIRGVEDALAVTAGP
jgi:dTDP-4-amino-4,6-dideoxygalactose transaminase